MSDFPTFLHESSVSVARKLLGCMIEREANGVMMAGRIVETEAYDQSDPASHTFRGKTARNQVMFGESGHAYVYFTYGMHYCFNVATGDTDHGAGVLIRAVEPLTGIDQMRHNRHHRSDHELTNGPAKLCQALLIDRALSGHNLRRPPLQLRAGHMKRDETAVQTVRVGISQAIDTPWRFYIADNPYVSKT